MATLYISEKQNRKARPAKNNPNGFVMIVSLVFLSILALLGSTAVVLTTTDMKIGSNYRDNTQALSAAQAGVAEALTRFNIKSSDDSGRIGDLGSTADPKWTAYILTDGSWTSNDDPDYKSDYNNYFPSGTDFTNTSPNVNTMQTSPDVSYFVKIRHKREEDAYNGCYQDNDANPGSNPTPPGSIIYYGNDPSDDASTGDMSWVYFTTTGNPTEREARPVEIIRSYGESNGSLAVVEAEVRSIALNIDTHGAVYAKDIITASGTVDIDGNDSAGSGGGLAGTCSTAEPAKPPFYVSPAGTTVKLSGSANTLAGEGEPFNPADYNNIPTDEFSGDIDIPVTEYVTAMGLPGAATLVVSPGTITNPQPADGWGDDGVGNSVIVYCDATSTSLKINNGGGYGLLVVDGDLELGGDFKWHGLIICSGTLTFAGGGSTGVNITGAVLANQTVTMAGTVSVHYDSCYIEESLKGMSGQVARWRRVY